MGLALVRAELVLFVLARCQDPFDPPGLDVVPEGDVLGRVEVRAFEHGPEDLLGLLDDLGVLQRVAGDVDRSRLVVDHGCTALAAVPVLPKRDHTVTHVHSLFERVGHHQDGHLAVEVQQQAARVIARFLVERSEGLVEQQDLGIHDQGSGNGHALALPTRELVRVLVSVLTQTELGEELHGLALMLASQLAPRTRDPAQPAARNGRLVQHGPERHVPQRGQVRVQAVVLVDHTAVRTVRLHMGLGPVLDRVDQTRGRPMCAHDHVEERGLAAAGRTDQGHNLPSSDLEVDVGQNSGASEGLADVLAFECHAGALLMSSHG